MSDPYSPLLLAGMALVVLAALGVGICKARASARCRLIPAALALAMACAIAAIAVHLSVGHGWSGPRAMHWLSFPRQHPAPFVTLLAAASLAWAYKLRR